MNISINIFAISGIVLAITTGFLFLILIIFGKSKLHRVCALFNLVLVLWGIGSFIIGITKDADQALIVWRYVKLSVTFIAILNYHVVYLLLKLKEKKILFFIYSQGIIFSVISLVSPLFISGVRFVFNSFFFDVPGPLYYPYVVLWFSIVIYTQILLLRFFLNSTGRLRTQILYFIMGQIFGFSGGITNFFPTFGIEFYPFGNFTIPIYCLVITYAILRYRLMDISIAITRTGIFIAVYSLILGIPFIVASAFRLRLTGYLGDKWWWVPMGLLTVLATVGPFIYIFIEKKAEEALLKEQRQYQNTLRQASSGMIRVRELKRLLNLIVHVVTRAVRLEFAAIYLFDADRTQYKMAAKRDSSKFSQDHTIDMDSPLIDRLQQIREPLVYEEVQLQSQDNPRDLIIKSLEQQLKEIKASVVIPSYVGNRMLGFIVLGKKKTGKIFTQDDLNVFSVLANQAALAIENAQFYEDIKETQEQLFQAEKMATIGTMADGLSHQINNRFQALSLISGDSLDILKTTDIANCSEGVKDAFSQLKYAFERVQSNVKQGGEIVRGLLKYSRPGETGFEFVEFNRIIDGALEMAQYKVRLNELNIIRNFPAGLPKIKCNLTQLEEIFFNMVDNAYDAIKERQALNKETKIQGEIKISAQAEDGNMRIIFEDNGIGVKDKDKEKLFTPFFTTKSTNRKGTGLGLYVIQKIVGFHEGTITIDSTYNKGTTFDILLPISQGK